MGNQLTNLPLDVDSFLADMAQMSGFFDYSDIIAFASVADSVQINTIREDASYLAELDFDIENDEEAESLLYDIAQIVKGNA